MRLQTLVVGTLLAIAAALTAVVGEMLGFELDHVALIGVALGATLALVPDPSPGFRLFGFAAGFVLAWIGYLLRAGLLPDTAAGRAVDFALVLLGCAIVAWLSAGRIPLWSTLVGVAALVGAYETAYTDAPSQVLRHSPAAATSVLLAAGLGFVAAALVSASPQPTGSRRAKPRGEDLDPEKTRTRMDDILKPERAQ